jgi:hypothetical protein
MNDRKMLKRVDLSDQIVKRFDANLKQQLNISLTFRVSDVDEP